MKSKNAKKLLCDALLELMKDKKLEDIKVSELIEKAGVSRNTYYYHFYKIDDVMAYMIDEFFKEFDEITVKNTSHCEVDDKIQKQLFYNIELEHCRLFYKHRDFLMACYRRGLGRKIMLEFIKHLENTRLMTNYYVSSLEKKSMSLKKDVFYEYYSYRMSLSYYSALECWIARNFWDSPEEVASYIYRSEMLIIDKYYYTNNFKPEE